MSTGISKYSSNAPIMKIKENKMQPEVITNTAIKNLYELLIHNHGNAI
jgi:hypothetical protein